MNIQTISIVVPTHGCVNNCGACVSKMHTNEYNNSIDVDGIKRRIKWAVMNGVNTCILTGTGEALQNTSFLEKLAEIFEEMGNPFPNVELQTTGVFLSDAKHEHKDIHFRKFNLLKRLGVSTVSLSIWSFDDEKNNAIIKTSPYLYIDLSQVIWNIKYHNMNVRFSLNMTNEYNSLEPGYIISKCVAYGANQMTIRKLYHNNDDSLPQTKWVKENACNDKVIADIQNYISTNGNYLYDLPFGGKVYSISEMSTVVDDDCMSKNSNNSLKYVILREDGKLYAQWDDKGSLIF